MLYRMYKSNPTHNEMFKVTKGEIDNICRKFNAPTLSQYLESTGNLYAIASFDNNGSVLPVDGNRSQPLIDRIKQRLLPGTMAGYVHDPDVLDKPVEVFIFNDWILKSKNVLLRELLILHEFCHLLDKQLYFKNLGLTLNEQDINVGEALHQRANKVDGINGWGYDADHNTNFGGILAHYIIPYNPTKWHVLLDNAMFFNFLRRDARFYLKAYNKR